MSHLLVPDTPGSFIFKILEMLSVFAQAYISISIIFPHKEILKASISVIVLSSSIQTSRLPLTCEISVAKILGN